MSDRRIGDLIQPGHRGDVVLFGFPHDRGVTINGGRPGAAGGPAVFRRYLSKVGVVDNPERNLNLEGLALSDAGDVDPSLDLPSAHEALRARTLEILQAGGIPFVVGGGNDQSWPVASALLDSFSNDPVGVINIDAHLDVRPLKDGQAHSGSSFRQLLEDGRFDGRFFIEFGSQGAQCSGEHARFVKHHGGQIYWLGDLRHSVVSTTFRECLGRLSWECDSLFISFDLDSVQSSDAPGVSCPSSVGLTAAEALEIAFRAGNHPGVRLFDLSEFNPAIEEDRTARLAAGMFYQFCLGVVARNGGA